MSPQRDNIGSLYATDNDPPSTKFKTPEGGAKSIDANSVCLAPKKAKIRYFAKFVEDEAFVEVFGKLECHLTCSKFNVLKS
ncbi:hypothetical protein V6N11_033869 [Hibiscus sabdariffa]|uniref:Uncharacterized protein n=1 Tax=Hibiscus sabdariffa TaxID=183260 RepID=A0ABR2S0V7_9ROSI